MYHGRSILAVIPARGGSKGVPRKNLRKVNDKSLLEISIETSKNSRYIDRVIVSSEDKEIIQEAITAGADVPFVRPENLARDDTPGIDPILHAIDVLEPYDYVMLLQVTSPLRTSMDIDQCIEYCFRQHASACVSVVEPRQHPCWMYSVSANKSLIPLFPGKTFFRRQDLPLAYAVNGAIYIAKTHWLQQKKTFITDETVAYLMPPERSIDIDSEFDFFLLDTYLKYNNRE